MLVPRLGAAQGVTTAAIQGTVSGEDGSAVAAAEIRVVNLSNGQRWACVSSATGRFFVENVAIGFPYRIEVRAVGYAPEVREGIALALGQRLVADIVLRPAAVALSPVTVTASSDPVLDPGRTGPADVIPRSMFEALPNLGRSFLNLTLLSPQAVSSVQTPAIATASGLAFDGQNRVYNSFQIDGAEDQDRYRGQLPGRESLPRPLSLDALEEIQVLVAPFDVRHGGFAGGLVNAVTRSGGNDVHGSFFSFLEDAALVRRGGAGGTVGDFTTWQYGATLGGPIVRDRLHYFLSVDVQHRIVPDPGPLISDTAGGADNALIGISYANAVRFRDVLQSRYGLDGGSLGPLDGRVPAVDVFGKITAQLATNSRLEGSYHYAHGNRQAFLTRTRGYYALSSFAQKNPATVHAGRLAWTSLLAGRWWNELLVSATRQRDECRPAATFPEIRVFFGDPSVFLDAGTPTACPAAALRQDALEMTDNATLGIASHVVSVGVHGELLSFRDELVNGSPGLWTFNGLDSLEAGQARLYQRTLPGPAWRGAVGVRALNLALYAQDRWNPMPALTLTIGLRLDVPFLPDAVPTNDSLKAALGMDTGHLPTGNPLWSPRLGVNYDLQGAGRTFLRGGIGLFAGSAPYRWLSNAYRDDGSQVLFLDCGRGQAPRFDPVNQPATCTTTGPQPQLSLFDPGVRLPQDLKLALGVDHRLSRGLVGTLDVLFTRAVHQLYLTDANLAPPSGVSPGEGNRPLYGTIAAGTGAATPTRLALFGPVVRVSDASGDRSWTVTTQLRTRGGGSVAASALYAYTRALDRMSLAHMDARTMLSGTVLDGTLENRHLATSLFEIRHRVQVTADVRLPLGMRVGLQYTGASGRPFTYTVAGDANADGMGVSLRQDPVYVPRDRSDITIDGNGAAPGVGTAAQQDSAFSALDAFIRAVPCLRNQRGRILARNSCRNSWFGTVNALVTKVFPTIGGQSLELTADVYNLLNLVNSRWGLSRYDGLTFGTDLLTLRGYDTTNGRGIYEVRMPPRGQLDDLASRWQIELGARYVF